MKINWQADTPYKTSIKFRLRAATSKEKLNEAIWYGPAGPDSYYVVSGSKIHHLEIGKWIQYEATFDTDNGAYSPVLEAVEITLQ